MAKPHHLSVARQSVLRWNFSGEQTAAVVPDLIGANPSDAATRLPAGFDV